MVCAPAKNKSKKPWALWPPCGNRCRFSESAICSSRVHPPSEIKSNFKFKTLRWRLTLSDKSAINLWGHSGRGHCRKFSANFHEIYANFPQNFRTLSWRTKTRFFPKFRELSAEFPQTFRKNPFANDPISELLIKEPSKNPSKKRAVA